MKPVDFRNITWDQLHGHLAGLRQQVYDAFAQHGPGTTREVSERSRISILTLRPRTTELVQLGFVECLGGSDDGREAVYIAVPPDVVRNRFEYWRRQPVQSEFPF